MKITTIQKDGKTFTAKLTDAEIARRTSPPPEGTDNPFYYGWTIVKQIDDTPITDQIAELRAKIEKNDEKHNALVEELVKKNQLTPETANQLRRGNANDL